MFRKITAISAAAALAGLGFAGLGGVANAQSCTGAACTQTQNVAGTVTIGTSLTLTVRNNLVPANPAGFTISNAVDGTESYAGSPTLPNNALMPVSAEVNTNDAAGYTLTQAITSSGNDFKGSGAGTGTDAIPASDTQSVTYTGGGNGPAGAESYQNLPDNGGLFQIGSNGGAADDTYYLGYGVTPPTGTVADTFNATYTVTAIAQ